MYETGQWPKDFNAVKIIAEDLVYWLRKIQKVLRNGNKCGNKLR
jgi:hypothetical protein